MKNETKNGKKRDIEGETRGQNITFWRCTICGGLNKTEEEPELCELCGEGRRFEKMQLKIKTSPTEDF